MPHRMEPIPEHLTTMETPAIDTGIDRLDSFVNDALFQAALQVPTQAPMLSGPGGTGVSRLVTAGTWIWAAGVLP